MLLPIRHGARKTVTAMFSVRSGEVGAREVVVAERPTGLAGDQPLNGRGVGVHYAEEGVAQVAALVPLRRLHLVDDVVPLAHVWFRLSLAVQRGIVVVV